MLHPDISISWELFRGKNLPELPPGIPVDIVISIDEQILVSGKYGIVWASWDKRQAEVLHNALLAQSITSAIGKIELDERFLLLIIIDNKKDIA